MDREAVVTLDVKAENPEAVPTATPAANEMDQGIVSDIPSDDENYSLATDVKDEFVDK